MCAFGPSRNLIRVTAHQLWGLAVRINSAGLCGSTPVKSGGHTERMNEITREEFNAKLETIEVKMDARVESVSAKIDGFLFAQAERDKRLDATLSQISANHAETQSSLGSMKTAMVVTAVSTVLAIVFGIASFNTALTANMMAAFQVGLSKSEQSQVTNPAPTVTPENPANQPAQK